MVNPEKMDGASPENDNGWSKNKPKAETKDPENLSTPEQVVRLMESSKSEKEWNDNCGKVQAAHNGYPDWWYEKIIMSGVAARTQAKWNK